MRVDVAAKCKMILDFTTGCVSTGGSASQSVKFPLAGVLGTGLEVADYDPEEGCYPTVATFPSECALDLTEMAELEGMLQEFKEVFDEVPGQTSMACHSIDVGDAKPVRSYPYRMSEDRAAALNKELDKLLAMGKIEPSTAGWAAPVVMVPKKNGQYRMCIDYRKLN